MFNKYSLTFKDNKLEHIYQEYQNNTRRKPLLFKLIINSATFLILNLIQQIIEQNYFFQDLKQLAIFSFNILQVILFIIIYQKKPNQIRWLILFYNHVLFVYYYNMLLLQPQLQIILTLGIACLQIVNGLSGEFFEAFYQITVFSTLYLIIQFTYSNIIDYTLIIEIITAIIILSSAFYQNIKALRSQFQLSNMDNQWESIFTTLIKNQYLIFQYKDLQQSFNVKNSDNQYLNIKNDEELREFLRSSKVQIQTLEQFIFQKIKKNYEKKNLVNQVQSIIQPGGMHNKIIYSIFFGAQTIIFIQLQHIQQAQKSIQYSIEKMYQTRYKQFVLLIQKVVEKNKKKQNYVQMAYSLRKYCLYAHLKDIFYQRNQNQLTDYICQIQFKSIVKTLQSMFFNKHITYENCIGQDIIGCKQLILIVLIEIIEKSISQFISLSFQLIDAQMYSIKVYCLYEDKKTLYLKKWANLYQKQILCITFEEQYIQILFKQLVTLVELKTTYQNDQK